MHRAACCLLTAAWLLAPAPAAAQPQERDARALERRIYRLEHVAAGEAAGLIYPLLSERGRLELRPGEQTLVARDEPATLDKIAVLLAEIDRPPRRVDLSVKIVSAEGRGGSPVAGEGLSPELARRLHELLGFDRYELMAGASLAVREGLAVARDVGGRYRVEFKMDRVRADRRVKLDNFKVLREDADGRRRQLIHTNLNLWLDRPLVLGLARTESSERALMIVLEKESDTPQGGRLDQ